MTKKQEAYELVLSFMDIQDGKLSNPIARTPEWIALRKLINDCIEAEKEVYNLRCRDCKYFMQYDKVRGTCEKRDLHGYPRYANTHICLTLFERREGK